MSIAENPRIIRMASKTAVTPNDLFSPFSKQGNDIVVVPRLVDFDMEAQLHMASLGEYRMRIEPAIAPPVIRDSLNALSIDCQGLADDICESIELFSKAFQQPRVDLRIEVTDEQSCPKFHCDNVFVRMLTTYAGPGTEYIYVDRPNSIIQAPANALVLLKGHRHPNHQDTVHHRSPKILPGQRRLCVIYNCDQWLGARAK